MRADNTFSFQAVRFEAPRHLPDRTIQVRFERKTPIQRVVAYYKGERMGEARPLNAIANDRPPKKPGSNPDGAVSPVPPRPKDRPPAPDAGAASQPGVEPSTPNP